MRTNRQHGVGGSGRTRARGGREWGGSGAHLVELFPLSAGDRSGGNRGGRRAPSRGRGRGRAPTQPQTRRRRRNRRATGGSWRARRPRPPARRERARRGDERSRHADRDPSRLSPPPSRASSLALVASRRRGAWDVTSTNAVASTKDVSRREEKFHLSPLRPSIEIIRPSSLGSEDASETPHGENCVTLELWLGKVLARSGKSCRPGGNPSRAASRQGVSLPLEVEPSARSPSTSPRAMSTPAPTDLPTDAGAAKAPDAGAGPAGTAEEERALPPSMTPNLPGIDGLSEEEIASFMESLDEFTPTVRCRPRDQPPARLLPPRPASFSRARSARS